MKKILQLLALTMVLTCFGSALFVNAANTSVDITKLTNAALNKPVVEYGHGYESEWWNKNFLTDGFKMQDDRDGQTNGWMSEYSQNIDEETWAYVDLEETYTIQAVAVYPRESGKYFPVAYEIQLSMDAENWTTVHRVTMDNGDITTNRVFGIQPTEAQYVRILVTERYDENVGGNGYLAEITEIEVYEGTAASPSNPTTTPTTKPTAKPGTPNTNTGDSTSFIVIAAMALVVVTAIKKKVRV